MFENIQSVNMYVIYGYWEILLSLLILEKHKDENNILLIVENEIEENLLLRLEKNYNVLRFRIKPNKFLKWRNLMEEMNMLKIFFLEVRGKYQKI